MADKYMRILSLGPFLYGMSVGINDHWINALHKVNLLISLEREKLIIELSDEELELVDLVELAIDLVVKNISTYKRNDMKEMIVVLHGLDTLATNDSDCTKSILKKASESGVIQDLWSKIFKLHSQKIIEARFAIVYVLYVYSAHVGQDNVKIMEQRETDEKQQVEKIRIKGNECFKQKEFKEAVGHYSECLKRWFGRMWEVLYSNRAQAFLKLDKHWAALSDAKRAVVINPNSIKSWYRYAQADIQLKKFDEALNANQKALNILRVSGGETGIKREELEQQCDSINEAIEEANQKLQKTQTNKVEMDDSGVPELVSDSGESDHEVVETRGKQKKPQKKHKPAKNSPPQIPKATLETQKPVNSVAASKNTNRNKTSAASGSKAAVLKENVNVENSVPRVNDNYKELMTNRSRVKELASTGSAALLDERWSEAIENYRSALDLIESVSVKSTLMEPQSHIVLEFAYSMANIEMHLVETINRGIKNLNNVLDCRQEFFDIKFPLGYYGIAKGYIDLCRYSEAVEPLMTARTLLVNCHGSAYQWPQSSSLIPYSRPKLLIVAVEKELLLCRYPTRPHGVCQSHVDMPDAVINIYLKDPGFKGCVTMVCRSNCLIDYHPACWKKHKQLKGDRVTDKDLLETLCPTPDCGDSVYLIKTLNQNLKEHEIVSDRVIPKVKKEASATFKMPKSNLGKIERKDQKKERRTKLRTDKLLQEKSLAESDWMFDDMKQAVPDSSNMEPDNRTDAASVIMKDLSVPDDDTGGKSKLQKKKKPTKVKSVLDVSVNFADHKTDKLASASLYDDYALYNSDVQDQVDKYNNLFEPTKSLAPHPTQTSNIHDYLYSYFAEILDEHGPVSLDDPALLGPLENLPLEHQTMIQCSGGLPFFLAGNLTFAVVSDIVCLHKDVARAKEMAACKVQLNPDAAPFTSTDTGLDEIELGDAVPRRSVDYGRSKRENSAAGDRSVGFDDVTTRSGMNRFTGDYGEMSSDDDDLDDYFSLDDKQKDGIPRDVSSDMSNSRADDGVVEGSDDGGRLTVDSTENLESIRIGEEGNRNAERSVSGVDSEEVKYEECITTLGDYVTNDFNTATTGGRETSFFKNIDQPSVNDLVSRPSDRSDTSPTSWSRANSASLVDSASLSSNGQLEAENNDSAEIASGWTLHGTTSDRHSEAIFKRFIPESEDNDSVPGEQLERGSAREQSMNRLSGELPQNWTEVIENRVRNTSNDSLSREKLDEQRLYKTSNEQRPVNDLSAERPGNRSREQSGNFTPAERSENSFYSTSGSNAFPTMTAGVAFRGEENNTQASNTSSLKPRANSASILDPRYGTTSGPCPVVQPTFVIPQWPAPMFPSPLVIPTYYNEYLQEAKQKRLLQSFIDEQARALAMQNNKNGKLANQVEQHASQLTRQGDEILRLTRSQTEERKVNMETQDKNQSLEKLYASTVHELHKAELSLGQEMSITSRNVTEIKNLQEALSGSEQEVDSLRKNVKTLMDFSTKLNEERNKVSRLSQRAMSAEIDLLKCQLEMGKQALISSRTEAEKHVTQLTVISGLEGFPLEMRSMLTGCVAHVKLCQRYIDEAEHSFAGQIQLIESGRELADIPPVAVRAPPKIPVMAEMPQNLINPPVMPSGFNHSSRSPSNERAAHMPQPAANVPQSAVHVPQTAASSHPGTATSHPNVATKTDVNAVKNGNGAFTSYPDVSAVNGSPFTAGQLPPVSSRNENLAKNMALHAAKITMGNFAPNPVSNVPPFAQPFAPPFTPPFAPLAAAPENPVSNAPMFSSRLSMAIPGPNVSHFAPKIITTPGPANPATHMSSTARNTPKSMPNQPESSAAEISGASEGSGSNAKGTGRLFSEMMKKYNYSKDEFLDVLHELRESQGGNLRSVLPNDLLHYLDERQATRHTLTNGQPTASPFQVTNTPPAANNVNQPPAAKTGQLTTGTGRPVSGNSAQGSAISQAKGQKSAELEDKNPKNTFDKLVRVLRRIFPDQSVPQFRERLSEVRQDCGGTFADLSQSDIINRVTDRILDMRNSPTTTESTIQAANPPQPSSRASPAPQSEASPSHPSRSGSTHECSICMDPVSGNGDSSELRCRHIFHDQCLRKWLRINSTCPTCRDHALLLDEFPPLK